ncbi:YceI family protein [Microbacterium rhizophilus]|uniref:YceI family protein n=1 Tax=Microbacterium rhizophilus TaxID=3138934 RepID=UPI0031EA20B6
MTTLTPDTAALVGTWTIDPAHTRVGFSARHAMVTTVRGAFADFDGTIDVRGEADASIEVRIRTASVTTGQDGRDTHLRSADFFDAEAFPEIVFRSTAIEVESDDEFTLVGDLTIKDVTREVRIAVETSGVQTDHRGSVRAGFEGTLSISRADFGLTWNVALDAGGWLVSDKIKIELDVSAVKDA